MPGGRVDHLVTVAEPWMLEPDVADLAALLREAADARASALAARGAAGRAAAEAFGWDAVAACYGERIAALSVRAPRPAAAERELEGAPAVLATPAWRADDDLPALLSAWSSAPAGACLYLLADPATDGTPQELEARVMAAADGHRPRRLRGHRDPARARGARPRRRAARRRRPLRPLHPACAGHVRKARAVAAPAELAACLADAPVAHVI